MESKEDYLKQAELVFALRPILLDFYWMKTGSVASTITIRTIKWKNNEIKKENNVIKN